MSEQPITQQAPSREVLWVHVQNLQATIKECISKSDFAPVRAIVYGLVFMVLTGFFAGVAKMIFVQS